MSNVPPSKLIVYSEGKRVKQITYLKSLKSNLKGSGLKFFLVRAPRALLFVTFDLIRALKTIGFSCDIFFAQHFLPAFIAVTLRKMGILHCNKIYFMMFDFFLIPPGGGRGFYYWGIDRIQRYVRKNIDEIWYTTPRIEESDKERYGVLPARVTKRFTGPIFFKKIEVSAAPEIPPLRLAFLGSLRANTGIREAIDSVLFCMNNGMEVELYVVGSGPQETELKSYLKQNRMEEVVTLFGYVNDGNEIAKIFSKCHLGIALYSADPYSPNWFLTSGKFRRFVSQGLPIVTSTVPYFGKYIYDYNAGFVVDNDPQEVGKVLRSVYDDPTVLIDLRQGVENLYTQFSTDRVLTELFKKSFQQETTN